MESNHSWVFIPQSQVENDLGKRAGDRQECYYVAWSKLEIPPEHQPGDRENSQGHEGRPAHRKRQIKESHFFMFLSGLEPTDN